jgi:hypothetical protein
MNENVLSDQAEPVTFAPAHAAKHHHVKLSHRARWHVAIEFLLGLIGLYGIGFLLSGKIRAGVGALIFSALWLVIRLVFLAVTAGFALVFLLPLTIIFAFSHAATLRRTLRQALLVASA